MIVRLSWSEVRPSAPPPEWTSGSGRASRSAHNYGAPDDQAWQVHVEGKLGELAVAKAFDLYWGPGTFATRHDGDVCRLEVRTTPRSGGALICHPEDPDDRAFILVTGQAPAYRLAGWIPGGDAKREAWWRTDVRAAAYFVPQSALRPIEELVEVHP